MQCPKCDKEFDGQHCMCGYVTRPVPKIKNIIHTTCEFCGKEMEVFEWFGNINGDSKRLHLEKRMCPECYLERRYAMSSQESKDDWYRRTGRIAMSPKRLAQSRNFDKWCNGEL